MALLANIVSGVTAVAALGAALVDHDIHRRSSDVLDRSVYRGPTDRRCVALTFDDGPSLQTPDLLAMLQREEVRATFFQLGMQVERFPEIARRVQADGHEIGSHAWSHVRLKPYFRRGFHFPTPTFIHQELVRTQKLLAQVHGAPPRLFRPPHGDRWIGLDAVQQRLGLKAIQWTVLGHDWEWSASRIADHVLAKVTPGAIICLHDGRDVQPTADLSEMLAALRRIVPELRRAGYSLTTVSELLAPAAASRLAAPV